MSNPMFQHRHYAALADMLADLRQNGALDTEADTQAVEAVEDAMVRLFKADNYGFKPDRFRAAASRAPNMHGRDKVR